MRLAILVVGAAIAGVPAVAQEMSAAERAHQLRNSHMSLYSANLGPLVGMARGEVEYDAETAALHAGNIAAYAAVDLTPLWIEGSSSEELEDSRALPSIWENLEDVAAYQQSLEEAALAAAEAAPEGQEAFVAAFREVGQTCGGCHEDYRQPDD